MIMMILMINDDIDGNDCDNDDCDGNDDDDIS